MDLRCLNGPLALATGLVLLSACGNTEEDPTGPATATGSVEVTVTTTGQDLDSEYSVSVGGAAQTVAANGSVTFTGVAVGSKTVSISGVAGNCTVSGASSQSVTVLEAQVAMASFAVVCTANPTEVSVLLQEAIDSLGQAMFTALHIPDVAGLDDFSFAAADSLFREALAEAPSNDTAAFGVAVTTIFLLEDDPDVRTAAEQWEAWANEGPDPVGPVQKLFAPATPLSWGRATLPLDFSGADVQRLATSGMAASELARSAGGGAALAPPPSITDHQALLSDVVAPALEAALAALQEITNAEFTFTVTEEMQGELPIDADPLELDYTEVLALQAGIEVALASINVVTAYSLQPNPTSVSGFVDAMAPGSDFLTLEVGGAAKLSDALSRLQSAADILLDGLDALEAESDDQSDDIIKYDPTGTADGLGPADIADARNVISDVKGSLSGPTTVTLNEGEFEEFSFMLDAAAFFNDPIQDFKALLPGYDVGTAFEEAETVAIFRWTDLNVDDWTFPDLTFNGILPDMTYPVLLDDLGVGQIFFELSLVGGYYDLITVDGVDCLDSVSNGGAGCPVDGQFYYGGSVDVDGFNTEPEAWVYLDGSSFVSDNGSYTVADDAGTIELTLSLSLGDLTATFVDLPGYTSIDTYGRRRGGSTLTIEYLGSTWIFEKQQ